MRRFTRNDRLKNILKLKFKLMSDAHYTDRWLPPFSTHLGWGAYVFKNREPKPKKIRRDKILIYIWAFLIWLSSDWLRSLLVQSISQKLILKSVILNIVLSICWIIQIYFVVKQKRIEVWLNILAWALWTYLSLI